MDQVIIFPQENGSIAILYPTGELPITEVARKDVPAGKPYLFIPIEDVPTDDTFFDAFEADFSEPDGFGIGSDAWFAEQAAKEQP